jgi:predicted extracellular nuclease
MRHTIFEENFNGFLGTGLASNPDAGQLDSNVWSFSKDSFNTSADLARGETDGGVGTGGLYAVDRGDDEGNGLLIQPGGSDFTLGDMTLTLNSGDSDLTDVTVSFDRLVINDQNRANSFDFSYSLDGVTFITLDSFVSAANSDSNGLTSETVIVSLPDLPAGTSFQLRWTGNDASGSGARDEFGIDNLVVDGLAESGEPGDTPEGDIDGDDVIINEVLASTTGADSEYVELFGTPGASLAGLSFIAVESNNNANPGEIEFRFDFVEGAVIGANGFYLLANDTAQATYGVVANATMSASLENSSVTYALVKTESLQGNSVSGSEVVLDAVASFDTKENTVFFDAPIVGPDGKFFPAGVGRIEDGVDTDTSDDFKILSFKNDVNVNTPTAGTVAETFVESFENAPGETYTIDSAFDDGGFDFFGRFAAPDDKNAARKNFNNFDGDFAIFAQDNDGQGGNATQVIAIRDIDVSVYADPKLTLSLGALDSTKYKNYEDGDGIRIYANLDEGGRELIGQFVNNGSAGNLLQDTDLDDIGDGTTLTTALQDFTFDLPDGKVLDVEIELTSNDSFEPLVVDNLRVGDDIPDNGGGKNLDGEPTAISAIQGTEDTAALVGQTVLIEAIVTGDFQNGDADTFRELGGFFLMEEVSDRDDNALTSEGIFAYEGGNDLLVDVQDGDRVRVLGKVVERFGKTSIEVTEMRVEEAGAVDPLSLAVKVELPEVQDREALESMLVTIDEALTFSESFDYEKFGNATLTTDGVVYQYTLLNTPDADGAAAHNVEVANRSITITGGSDGKRKDFAPITEPDGDLVEGPTDGVRMCQSVSDLTAVFDYAFGEYRLRLPETVDFKLDEDTNPVPLKPEEVGSEYKVASLNVLNFFTTLKGSTDNGKSPRGADNPEELARQTAKLVEVISGLDSDVIGLVEIENDFAGEDFALKTLVEAINEAEGTDTWAFVDPGTEFVGGDAIAGAFIYNSATTSLVGGAAILDSDEFIRPLGTKAVNRAALAQTFQDKETGGIFTASVNHFKSKGSLSGAPEDEDQGDGAGRNNATRTEAARILSEWLATDPTNSGDSDVVILGDLNAYAKETPIAMLESKGYTNLANHFEGNEGYSYRFSGQVGTLDYALANESLFGQVTGATTWNINSDTPVFFDYNLEGTFTGQDRPTDQGLFDGTTPLRSSDHDPLIIGLKLDDGGNNNDDPMRFYDVASAGRSFNCDGDSHGKHPLKGTNGENDLIDPFGGRAKDMIKDGTFNDTKYGVDLGGRGNNSLFDLDELNEGADFSIRLHSNAAGSKTASLKTLHKIFHDLEGDYSDMTWSEKRVWRKEQTQEGRETFDRFNIGRDAAIKVTDVNGALTDEFKELLDAAFDLRDYADDEGAKDTDGFDGRVLTDGYDFVVQIAAEAYHGDDGAAEIMAFSGALANDMEQYVNSNMPETQEDFVFL